MLTDVVEKMAIFFKITLPTQVYWLSRKNVLIKVFKRRDKNIYLYIQMAKKYMKEC